MNVGDFVRVDNDNSNHYIRKNEINGKVGKVVKYKHFYQSSIEIFIESNMFFLYENELRLITEEEYNLDITEQILIR